jgi:hypothetical protein
MRKKEGKELKKNGGSVLVGHDPAVLPEYVPAELNLETIGFFSAGYKRRYPTEPHEAKVVSLGTQRQIRIVPSTYGYPNSEDLDLYRAFLKICDEHAVVEEDRGAGAVERRPRLKVPVCFSTKKLLQYAGYKKNAQILRRVQEWIKRGVITGIEGGIYEAKTRRIKEGVTFTLFGKAYLRGEQMADGTVADTNYVWPAEWFCSNYFLRYFRPVDLAFHRRLERPIAKTLYPILETGWYAADGGPYAKSYLDLCTLMYIPYHKQLSLAKQQLDPSHEELRREGFLAGWEYTLDGRGKWNGVLRWWPGAKWFHEQNARRGQRDYPAQYEYMLALPQLAGENLARPQGSVPEAESAEGVKRGAAHAQRVKAFYAQQKHMRVSGEKIEKEAKILERLENEGFTAAEIDVALSWLLRNRGKFGGEIHSLKLLPETIGQSLQEEKKQEEQKVRRAKERAQRQTVRTEETEADRQNRREREERIQDLSAGEQDNLQKLAVANLIRGGYKAEVVQQLKSLVKSEMQRMLDEGMEKTDR